DLRVGRSVAQFVVGQEGRVLLNRAVECATPIGKGVQATRKGGGHEPVRSGEPDDPSAADAVAPAGDTTADRGRGWAATKCACIRCRTPCRGGLPRLAVGAKEC